MQALRSYVRLARPDHWFKNIFCVPGIVLAAWFSEGELAADVWLEVAIGLLAVCFAASCNYVINEVLDAEKDRLHPKKRDRPAARGEIRTGAAVCLYLILLALAVGLGLLVNPFFLGALSVFCLMGIIYNVPPIRSKDLPYLDALSEAFNNPLRLALGWWSVTATMIPPASLLVAYWMLGSYLMTLKRFAEYRFIGDHAAAAAYRESFRHVNADRLLIAALIYASAFSLLLGVFFVKFRVELVLTFPTFALFLGSYLAIALRANSPIQYPEKLYRERRLMAVTATAAIICLVLLFVDLPFLEDWLRMPAPGQPVAASGSASVGGR